MPLVKNQPKRDPNQASNALKLRSMLCRKARMKTVVRSIRNNCSDHCAVRVLPRHMHHAQYHALVRHIAEA